MVTEKVPVLEFAVLLTLSSMFAPPAPVMV